MCQEQDALYRCVRGRLQQASNGMPDCPGVDVVATAESMEDGDSGEDVA